MDITDIIDNYDEQAFIQEYFYDNGVPDWSVGEEMKLIDRRRKYKSAKMVLADVNNQEEARHFFNEYDIPFQITKRGENKGKLRVMPIRDKDRRMLMDVKSVLKNEGFAWAVDHTNVFRDDNDFVVSPSEDMSSLTLITVSTETAQLRLWQGRCIKRDGNVRRIHREKA